MKKFILMFFLIHIFSYANYLISNSEIVLFYDKTYNNIQYIRGDVFNNIAISEIQGELIINKNEVIPLKKYIQGIELIEGTNILRLHYDIDGSKVAMTVIPSMVEKDELYFIVNFSEFDFKGKNVDFAFRIVPQYDNRFVEFDKFMQSYHYDVFSFRVENYYGDLYIARNSVLSDMLLEKIDKRSKKYQDDNMYYIIENIQKGRDIVFNIKFYKKFESTKVKNSDEIMVQELGYWNGINSEEKFEGQDMVTSGQLKNLEIITSRAVIPDQISFNKSKENLDNKMELYYINSTLNKDFNPMKLFEDINIRKKDSEAVLYYTLLFKYLNNTGNYIDPGLFDRKVSLEVLSLLDYVEEIDGAIINVRDNIRNYSWYFRMIENIKNRSEFADEKDFISEKENLLYEYVKKYYVLPDGLKTRRHDTKSDYKNIRYMDFMPKEYQCKILKRDFDRYFNKRYGLLIGPEDNGKVDLEYNLTFIIKLYENGEIELANRLLGKIEEIITQNNQFLMPSVVPEIQNPVGIYGEMLYLYFTAVEYKERYNNGNQK